LKLTTLTRTALFAITAAALPAAAQAQEAGGLYGRIDGGYSPGAGADIDTAALIGTGADQRDGYLVSGAIGFADSSGFRVEGELSHRQNKLKSSPTLDPGGKLSANSAMINGYYEFGGSEAKIRPYIGAGAGIARVKLRADNSAPLLPVSIDDKSTSIAYQGMAGVAVKMSDKLAVDVGYRYFVAPKVKGVALSPPAGPTAFDSDYKQHAATVGVRLGF
jgi:opacity protein-like surface antigen